jgi:hypothetical protein
VEKINFGYAAPGGRPCGKNAKYEHEGKWFCKIHHPPTVAEKNKARNERWEKKWAAHCERVEQKAEQQRRADLYPELLGALQNIAATARLAEEFKSDWCAAATGMVRMARAAIAKAEGK